MGWTQEILAQKLDSKQSRVSNWNTGSASPRYAEIIKLIELGANTEELFGKEAAEMLKSREPLDQSVLQRPEVQQYLNDFVRKVMIGGMSQALEDLKSAGPKPPQK